MAPEHLEFEPLEQVALTRYEDTGRIGTGADYEVRGAVDRESGKRVVLKRPVPQMISRNMHGYTEERTERTLQAYCRVGNSVPGLVPILGYTLRQLHDDFFGDSLGQEYRVTVEEHAVGLPLFVGDPRARITKVPVGAGQNLFALFPPHRNAHEVPFPVQQQLLDLEEAFIGAGYLLLDLRPQNVFYHPGTQQITVIDCGALVELESESNQGRRLPQDINDLGLEMLKFYATPDQPPTEAEGYRDPYGLRPTVNLQEELDEMAQLFGDLEDERRDAALLTIEKVRQRSYHDFGEFRRDYASYLELAAKRNQEALQGTAARQARHEALDWLKGDFWSRFLFDPSSDLEPDLEGTGEN